MLKFLRKYNKLILVVGGSLLMVVFLLPQAAQQFGAGNQRNATVFRIDGQSFRGADTARAARELDALARLGVSVGQAVQLFTGVAVESPTHWLLLTHLADRSGLLGGPQDGPPLLAQIAERVADDQSRMFASLPPDELEAQRAIIREGALGSLTQARLEVLQTGLMSERGFDMTLARARAVRRLGEEYLPFVSLSGPELALLTQLRYDTAVVDLVTLPAADVAADAGDPTEAQLAEHFEAYSDQDPRDNDFGVGYLQPPAIKFETLQLNRNPLFDAIEVDPIEVNKYWRQNPDRFERFGGFEQARGVAAAALKNQRLDAFMQEALEVIRRETVRVRRGLETDPDNPEYVVLPDDWAVVRPSFEVLAERLNALAETELGVSAPFATAEVADGQWFTTLDLGSRPITSGALDLGARRVPFGQLAFATRELGAEEELGVQTGVAFGPLANRTGSSFYFRVLDVRPEGPPESLDAVRADAVRDWRAIRGFEILEERIGEYRSIAAEAGSLAPLADLFLNAFQRQNLEVTSDAVRAPRGGLIEPANAPAFRDVVVDRIRAWDPLVEAQSLPIAERVVGAAWPADRSVVIGIVTGRRPATIDALRRGESEVVMRAFDRLIPDITALNPLGFEALSAQLGFEDVAGDRQRAMEEEAAREAAEAEAEDAAEATG